MKCMIKTIMQVLMSVMVVVSPMAEAAVWGSDYDAALAQARASGKAVLVDFTGSDWCVYCIKLRKEVLDETRFAEWAENHFVLLEVDVPQRANFDRALRERNIKLCDQYKVAGYPTVLVLDDKGRPLGGLFGYIGDPETVRKTLEPGLKAVNLIKDAESCEGADKLDLLLEAWSLVPEELHDQNMELKAEIMSLDTMDRSGLNAAATAELRLQKCMEAVDAAPTDAVALDIVEDALLTTGPKQRKRLLEIKYKLLISTVDTEADVRAVENLAYELVDLDDRLSVAAKVRRKNKLQSVFANPQVLINRSRMMKRKRPIR